MNYIFLDVDGVLNSQDYLLQHLDDEAIIDENTVKLLGEFCQKHDCKIILSAGCRSGFTDEMAPKNEKIRLYDGHEIDSRSQQLSKLFYKYNINMVGKTSLYKYNTRGEEVLAYIKKHLTDTDNFIVLDDEDDNMTESVGKHFVQTKFYNGKGLDQDAINKMEKIIRGDFDEFR